MGAFLPLCLSSLLLGSTPAPGPGVRINEVLYDPAGRDDGGEFIELVNTSAATVSLAFARVEFHNGSSDGWEVVWTAGPDDRIGADTLFVIGGALVDPRPDAVVPLSLQNGPDALRLVIDDAVSDVVGYGGLGDAAYVESEGVGPVSSGASIGRYPDGVDTDDNAADFRPLEPSPGRWNRARSDVALAVADPTPVLRAEDGPYHETISVDVINAGTRRVRPGAVAVTLRDSTAAGIATALVNTNAGAIDAGGAETLRFDIELAAGYHFLDATARAAADERAGNNRVSLVRRAERISILVSEVMSYPRDGCTQFVELYNAGSVDVDLAQFGMRDHAGDVETLVATDVVLGPARYLVVTADPDVLRRCHPDAPPDAVIAFGGRWPSFNRAGSGVSDSVIVTDRYGLVVDAVGYPPVDAGSAGRSLERVSLYVTGGEPSWLLSTDAGGATPGRRGARAIVAPPETALEVTPNPFAPARGDVLVVSMRSSPGIARAVVSVYDLRGRRIADLGAVAAFPAVLLWDGHDASGRSATPGGYILACEVFADDGRRVAVEKVVVGCAP